MATKPKREKIPEKTYGPCPRPGCEGRIEYTGSLYWCSHRYKSKTRNYKCSFIVWATSLDRLGKAKILPEEMECMLAGQYVVIEGLKPGYGRPSGKLEFNSQWGWQVGLSWQSESYYPQYIKRTFSIAPDNDTSIEPQETQSAAPEDSNSLVDNVSLTTVPGKMVRLRRRPIKYYNPPAELAHLRIVIPLQFHGKVLNESNSRHMTMGGVLSEMLLGAQNVTLADLRVEKDWTISFAQNISLCNLATFVTKESLTTFRLAAKRRNVTLKRLIKTLLLKRYDIQLEQTE